MTMLLLSVSAALSPAGTERVWEGVMGWTRIVGRGVMRRDSGMGTGRGLGCLGLEGEGGSFGLRAMGNWTHLGW